MFAQHSNRHPILPLDTDPATYICFQTIDSIVVDGLPLEATWSKALPLSDFVDIEGVSKPLPTFNTFVQMAWDSDCLYLYTYLEEPHIWASLENHDDIVWRDNDFEIFIDADQDTHNYVEFEYNAFGTLLDLFMVKPYRDGGPMLIEWDAKGVQAAIHLDGSVNNGNDIDVGWGLELAIPFTAVKTHRSLPNPSEGTRWHINFSRVQWDLDWNGSVYEKRVDANDKLLPEHNWVWSPQGIINMHYPEKWGYMQFSVAPVGTEPFPFFFVAGDAERQWLREVYFAQRIYKTETGSYAKNLRDLVAYNDDFEPVIDSLTLHPTPSGYECQIVLRENLGVWSIDETGHTWKTE